MTMLPNDLVRTLLTIADTGSLDAAARRLEITPSAVSQRLKSLETLLDRVLLVRSKPARLTDAGASIVRFARETQQLEQDALRSLGIVPENGRARVRIHIDSDLREHWLGAIAAAAMEVPMDLDVFDEDGDEPNSPGGRVLISVSTEPTEEPGWETHPLGAVRYDAVASPSFIEHYGLLRPGSVGPADVPTIVVRGREGRLRGFLAQQGYPQGWSLSTVSSTEMARAMVLAGVGWALLPRTSTGALISAGRVQCVSAATTSEQYHLQRWGVKSPAGDALMRQIRDRARSIFETAKIGIQRGGLSDAPA